MDKEGYPKARVFPVFFIRLKTESGNGQMSQFGFARSDRTWRVWFAPSVSARSPTFWKAS